MSCVNSSSVFPKTITMKVGTWYTPANADVYSKDLPCESIEWSSEDPSIAGVNATNGYIYGNSVGTTTVHGRSAGCGEGGSIIVDVVETIPVCSVEFEYSSLFVEYSEKVELNAIVTPSNATNKKLNWSSTNSSVATVDSDGVVTAVSEGTAVITATSKYDSNKSASCTINVTKQKLVKKITVTAENDIVAEGYSTQFKKKAIPSYALDTSVTWSSDSPHIATVNSCNGIVYGIKEGEATIYATANDGSGVVGCCRVTVIPPILAECVDLGPTKITLAPDDEEPITASIVPPYASRRTVRWESDNPGIATVVERVPAVNTDVNFAVVKGVSKGTTTITATATDGTEKKSKCIVTVDPREKVIIEKDNEYSQNGDIYFNIIFSDGKIWKNVGCDLFLDENRSDPSLDFDEIYYDEFNKPEQRYINNSYVDYTPKQLAFAYLCDPLGVEYYLKTYSASKHNISFADLLRLRDSVFKEIFGAWPRLIKIFPDGTVNYWVYQTDISDADRLNYYTDAEILFGGHNISDGISIVAYGYNVLCTIVMEFLSLVIPGFGEAMAGVDLVRSLYFNGAVENVISTGSSGGLQLYFEDIASLGNTEAAVKKMSKGFGALLGLLNIITTAIDSLNVFAPSLDDLRVYKKINTDHFRSLFIVDGYQMDMQEIIDHIES